MNRMSIINAAFLTALTLLTGCKEEKNIPAAQTDDPVLILTEQTTSVTSLPEKTSSATQTTPENTSAAAEKTAEDVTEAETVPYETLLSFAADTEKHAEESGTAAENDAYDAAIDDGEIFTEECFKTPTITEAIGDIISISVGDNFLDCTVSYDKLKLLEDESTSSTLYFQALSPGKDNIIISENGNEGIILREYAVIISDDLEISLIPVNGEPVMPVPYADTEPYIPEYDWAADGDLMLMPY